MKGSRIVLFVAPPLAAAAIMGLLCPQSHPVLAAAEVERAPSTEAPPAHAKVVIPVKGMTCGGCAAAIKVAVKKLDGVVAVEADHEAGTATITYSKDKVTVEKVIEAINRTGYKAEAPEKEKKPGR